MTPKGVRGRGYFHLTCLILFWATAVATSAQEDGKRPLRSGPCIEDSALRLVRCGYVEKCIHHDFRCDDVIDCDDGSDENEATCRGVSTCEMTPAPKCPAHSTCRSVAASDTRMAHHVCDCISPIGGANCSEIITEISTEDGKNFTETANITVTPSTNQDLNNAMQNMTPESTVTEHLDVIDNITTVNLSTSSLNGVTTQPKLSSLPRTRYLKNLSEMSTIQTQTVTTPVTNITNSDVGIFIMPANLQDHERIPNTSEKAQIKTTMVTKVTPEEDTVSTTSYPNNKENHFNISTANQTRSKSVTNVTTDGVAIFTNETTPKGGTNLTTTILPPTPSSQTSAGKADDITTLPVRNNTDQKPNVRGTDGATAVLVVVFGLLAIIPLAVFFHCRLRRKKKFSRSSSTTPKSGKEAEETVQAATETKDTSKPQHTRNTSVSSIKSKENSNLLGNEIPLDMNMNKPMAIPPVISITPVRDDVTGQSPIGAPPVKGIHNNHYLPDTQMWIPDDGSEKPPHFVTDNVPLPVSIV